MVWGHGQSQDVVISSDIVPPLVLAPFIGSFLGVLIARLPERRPVVFARSVCEQCGHVLSARDLVPLLSFALTRGRCRHCRSPIGSFPLAVELAALGVAVWTVLAVPATEIWWTCLLGWALLTLAWIDVRTMSLPDVLTIPLGLAGLVATLVEDRGALTDHAAAAIVGYGSLAGIAWIYRRIRHREGLGLGDAKLLAAIGAWLGISALPLTILFAACIGLTVAGAAALTGRHVTAASAFPFGPCLALSAWLLWLYGGILSDWPLG
jgi:leader peptidase (prepilin peptidase)/N-methyltransferase